ncbi:MAG: 3-dehydroquinate synthase [Candidatus Omnitrophica bacterium]|nr:3-dehydroquinate synthase [Candidatus Omnitrophota bacterium]
MTKAQEVSVRLGPRSYKVTIGLDHLSSLGGFLRRLDCGTHPILLTNATLASTHARRVRQALRRGGFPAEILTVGDSERSKSLPVLSRLINGLAAFDGPGRRLFLVLVGGGVVGDVGGLAAGLYRRGIPYVQIPTTLLAQVDSAIGGKTAVDLPCGKNLAGLFYQPRGVFIELRFLKSLPERQFRSGLAEAAKCGVIADPKLFRFLEERSVRDLRRLSGDLSWVIRRAVGVKASCVERDERETHGIRTILNFGHTLGHALEAATRYSGVLTHGEAISVGMAAATRISLRMRRISCSAALRIEGLLGHLGLPTAFRGVPPERAFAAMAHDKKWTQGAHRWVLPQRIGRAKVQAVSVSTVRAVLKEVLGK